MEHIWKRWDTGLATEGRHRVLRRAHILVKSDHTYHKAHHRACAIAEKGVYCRPGTHVPVS